MNISLNTVISRAVIILLFLYCLATLSSNAQISWVQKVSGGGLGNPFCVNPQNTNTIYSATGDNILRVSYDKGNTWQALSTITQGSQIKSVTVSATDTNTILVALEGGPPDRIVKTTNNGASWNITLTREFYYWGIPVAYIPESGNKTVYTMGDGIVFRSSDFGTTWDSIRNNPFGTTNKGWEYCVIRPDSENILLVGDNATGIWKSTDYGVNWRLVHTAGGEIPALACSKDNPRVIYGTHWSGGGGFVKSTDGGETWTYSAPLNGINMWSVAISTTNPNFVITGTYGPSYSTNGGIYISRDAGTTWRRTYLGLQATTNYGCFVLDTLSVFVLQGDGIWRYNQPTGSITVLSPNGGEIWHSYSKHAITWNAFGIANVKIEYSMDNGSTWHVIAASVPAASGNYLWTVPDSASANALVRISDVSNSSINDVSNATFTIDRVYIILTSPSGGEAWVAGSQQTIQWVSAGVLNVKAQLSTDNGSNWMEISSSMHASTGSYNWKIPHTPSNYCKIKVVNISSPDIYGINDSVFAIEDTVQFLSTITVYDTTGNSDTLAFGEKASATDGLDTTFGEHELPPKPPAGIFDARWAITGTNGTMFDLRDTLSNSHSSIVFSMEIQPGPAGLPIILKWDPRTFPLDYFTLKDSGTDGGLLSVDMLAESTCTITNAAITTIQVVHSLLTSMPIHVNNRWNIVSVPLHVDDRSKSTLFPAAISNAFGYTNKYHPSDTLNYGKGYWLKFSGEQTLIISGKQRTSDSVEVSAGWNMIGGLSKPLNISSIVTSPPGIISSSYFGYNGNYYPATSLYPGTGYWVKVSQSGWLILNSAPLLWSRTKE